MDLRSDSDGPNTTASQGMEERGKPSFPCNICGRIVQSKSGRINHEKKCKMKGPVIKANSGVEEENSTMQTSTVKLLTSHLEQSVEMNTLPPEPPDPPPSMLTTSKFMEDVTTTYSMRKLCIGGRMFSYFHLENMEKPL